MTKTTSTITKSTFIVTLNSIIVNYSANMLKWLSCPLKDREMDVFVEELNSFNNYLRGLQGGHTVAIRDLFGVKAQTPHLLNAADMYTLEQAEKNNEAWELLVVDDDGAEVVRLDQKQVNW